MPRIINLANLEQFTAVNALGSDLGAINGPVVIPQAAQIVLYWVMADGKQGHNVLYGRYAGTFNGSVAQANAIITALTTGSGWTGLAPFLSTTVSLGGVSIRNVAVADQPITVSTAPGQSGSGTGALPSEVAAVITLRTALVGRQNRGRMYVPGWATGATAVGDIISAAAVTALQNWANTIIGALSPSGYTLVIGQRQRAAYTSPVTGREFGPRPPNTVTVTQLVVRDNHWDSQRRRGLK